MRVEVSHQGVPLGHADLDGAEHFIGELQPGEGYSRVRDVIRSGSKALWAMGFFHPETAQPRVAIEDLTAASKLDFELRDEKGALVHADFVNIVEVPDPNARPMIIARFRQSHAGNPSRRLPDLRGDGSAAPESR